MGNSYIILLITGQKSGLASIATIFWSRILWIALKSHRLVRLRSCQFLYLLLSQTKSKSLWLVNHASAPSYFDTRSFVWIQLLPPGSSLGQLASMLHWPHYLSYCLLIFSSELYTRAIARKQRNLVTLFWRLTSKAYLSVSYVLSWLSGFISSYLKALDTVIVSMYDV